MGNIKVLRDIENEGFMFSHKKKTKASSQLFYSLNVLTNDLVNKENKYKVDKKMFVSCIFS